MRWYPDWLHNELINWCRFCWDGPYPHPLPPSHCYSVEHKYVAPSDLGEPEQARIIIRVKDALKVQAIYDAMPIEQKLVIRAEYPKRHESGRMEGRAAAARQLGIKTRQYDERLTAAIGKLWDSLEKREAAA